MLLQQHHHPAPDALDELSTRGDATELEMIPKATLHWFGWRQEYQYPANLVRCLRGYSEISMQPPHPL